MQYCQLTQIPQARGNKLTQQTNTSWATKGPVTTKPLVLGACLLAALVLPVPFTKPGHSALTGAIIPTKPINTPSTSLGHAQLAALDTVTITPAEVEAPVDVDTAEPGVDSVFEIVADQRAWARVQHLTEHAPEVLSAVAAREDKPIGLDFMAAASEVEVLLIDDKVPEISSGDRYQVLFRNNAGDTLLLLELSSLNQSVEGYEQLGFESLLAFSEAIDQDALGLTLDDAHQPLRFPYTSYPPVSYESALASIGASVDSVQSNTPSRLASFKDSEGNSLWNGAFGYEVSVMSTRGQSAPVWIDAFLGMSYTQQELDAIQANIERRSLVIAELETEMRDQLAKDGRLQVYAQSMVPLSPKELERIEASKAHEARYGTSVSAL